MLISEIARLIDGQFEDDRDISVTGIASLGQAGPEEISFISDEQYAAQFKETLAGAVIVSVGYAGTMPDCPTIRVADVPAALDRILEMFAPAPDYPAVGIHPQAWVDPAVELGEQVAIGAHVSVGAGTRIGANSVLYPGCRIGRDVVIGSNCILYSNVVINRRCCLGERVIIHPNSTIGADGFGYRLVDGRHRKIPHIGNVVIEDDVEIGANSCVDRAKFGQTIVGRNTKIDNLVQVAHNVRIGASCILVAQVGLAGSCELGNYVVLGGQTGVADHVKINDGAMIAGHSGVVREIAPGSKEMGLPSKKIKDFFRECSLTSKLPQLFKEVKLINERLNCLEKSDHHNQ